MNDQNNVTESVSQNPSTQSASVMTQPAQPAPLAPHASQAPSVFSTVQKITAWVMISSAVLFALIGIMAVWDVFGNNSDIVWRCLSSLAIIAFAALIINVSIRMVEERRK